MARTTIVQVTDDLDGSVNAEEVQFSFDGVAYAVDLSKRNKAALEKALRPYIQAGRKVPRGSGRAKSTGSGKRRDLDEVRAWAKQAGIKVSDRGRVAASVLEQFDAAH